jgi:glycosyltransferase involved in cell wall biosynthesis
LVFVEHWPGLSGAARVLLTALSCLDRGRFRAVIVCNPGPLADEARAQGHEVVELDLSVLTFAGGLRGVAALAPRFAWAARRVGEIARGNDAVAIHANGLAPALFAGLQRRSRAPVIWHVHEIYDDRSRMRPFVVAATLRARSIVCVSRAAAERVIRLGARRARCRVVHNCLPAPVAGAAPPDDAPLREGGPLLVSIGVITPAKGHSVLVDAMPEILRRHPLASAAILGKPLFPGDVAYLERMQAEARRLGVADRVTFLGFRSDVARILSRAAVLVHPARYEETFGLVLLEAMNAGIPVVASRVGGTPEVVEDGVSGLLVPPGDPAALASAVADLLADEARRARMGAAGRALEQDRFSLARMLDGLNAAYEDVIGAAPFRLGSRAADHAARAGAGERA